MGAFSIVVEGDTRTGDRTEIRKALDLLIRAGEIHELRALPSGQGRVVSGDDLDAAANAALEMSDQMVYWSLNPIHPGAVRASKQTVLCRVWFLVDVDPIRPQGVSATEEEKGKAYVVAATAAQWLLDQGWPAPLIVDSGNGWHLLYRIDLPNDKLSQALLKSTLEELDRKFSNADAKIDKVTHDAPRVSKLPGTFARRGPDTAERPHRMCRVVIEPDTIETVTVDQLKAVGSPPRQGETSRSEFSARATDGAGKTAYVQSAIERECYRVLIAPQGERNVALNTAAFKLGQFDGWPEMVPQTGRAALQQAARQAGLTDHEIKLTIQSGWAAGVKQPRQRPDEPTNGQAPKGIPAKLTVGLSEITPKKVDWLWENVVAAGFISIFAGRTGMGKSFVTCDFAARLTRGEPPAYSSLKRPACRVLFISEDPPEFMLGPRLIEMKASQDMVRFMTFEAMAQFNLSQLDLLEAAYQECGQPSLIVIDPPSNFLGKTDEHKNSELRGVLMGVVAWINRHNVACVMITHLNKAVGKGLDAVSRVMGSVAWVSTARITMVFEQDPDKPTQFLMGGGKNNLGQKAGTLAYEIETAGDCAVVKWVGPVETTADDAVNKVKKKSAGVNAVEWLIEIFTQQSEWESAEVKRMAREVGVSNYALFQSPEVLALPIKKKKRTNANGEQYWVWRADENWPPKSSESSESSNVSPINATDIKDSDSEIIDRIFKPY